MHKRVDGIFSSESPGFSKKLTAAGLEPRIMVKNNVDLAASVSQGSKPAGHRLDFCSVLGLEFWKESMILEYWLLRLHSSRLTMESISCVTSSQLIAVKSRRFRASAYCLAQV